MDKDKPKLTIIVPAYNEERNISLLLQSLFSQIDKEGRILDKSFYQILVVDNNSSDNTYKIVKKFKERENGLKIKVASEKKKGVISARIKGANFVLNNHSYFPKTEYLAFCDADVVVFEKWVDSILDNFGNTNFDVLSYTGAFPLEFWKNVPLLTKKYLDEIGTIFFDNKTIEWLGVKEGEFKFTGKIFSDFVRPPSGGFYAIRTSAYIKTGGYAREFVDDNKKIEVDGPTWRLYFELQLNKARISFIKDICFECSPRRLLGDPYKFFKIQTYDQLNDLEDYRNIPEKQYEKVNKLANRIDLRPVQRYIIEYYILLPCINRPEFVKKNRKYFSYLEGEIESRILDWWENHPNPRGQDIFLLCKKLTDKYFEKLLEIIPKQIV